MIRGTARTGGILPVGLKGKGLQGVKNFSVFCISGSVFSKNIVAVFFQKSGSVFSYFFSGSAYPL